LHDDNKPVVFELVAVVISSESFIIEVEWFFVTILQSSLTIVMADISDVSLVMIFESA